MSDADIEGSVPNASEQDGDADTPPGDPEWHADYHPTHFRPFTPRGPPGPTRIMPGDRNEFNFFSLLVGDDIITRLIEESNKNALFKRREYPENNHGAWEKPTLAEMRAFIGLCFLMGVNPMPCILATTGPREKSCTSPFLGM